MKRKLTVFVSLVLLLVLVCTTAFARTSKEVARLQEFASVLEVLYAQNVTGVSVSCTYFEELDAVCVFAAMDGLSGTMMKMYYEAGGEQKNQCMDPLTKLYDSTASLFAAQNMDGVNLLVCLCGEDGLAALAVLNGTDITPFMS